jgi:hypothetical protein
MVRTIIRSSSETLLSSSLILRAGRNHPYQMTTALGARVAFFDALGLAED